MQQKPQESLKAMGRRPRRPPRTRTAAQRATPAAGHTDAPAGPPGISITHTAERQRRPSDCKAKANASAPSGPARCLKAQWHSRGRANLTVRSLPVCPPNRHVARELEPVRSAGVSPRLWPWNTTWHLASAAAGHLMSRRGLTSINCRFSPEKFYTGQKVNSVRYRI